MIRIMAGTEPTIIYTLIFLMDREAAPNQIRVVFKTPQLNGDVKR